jgi:hypothetical protein
MRDYLAKCDKTTAHVVLNVTLADTPFEEGVHVLAHVLGRAALAGLGDPVHASRLASFGSPATDG